MPVLQFCFMGYAATVKHVRVSCPKPGPRGCCCLFSEWVFRVRGASSPGPAADDDSFVLGIANPHGLRGPAPFCCQTMERDWLPVPQLVGVHSQCAGFDD